MLEVEFLCFSHYTFLEIPPENEKNKVLGVNFTNIFLQAFCTCNLCLQCFNKRIFRKNCSQNVGSLTSSINIFHFFHSLLFFLSFWLQVVKTLNIKSNYWRKWKRFLNIFCICPIWLPVFFLFFYNEPELGVGIDPGMALTSFPSSILDETRFKPTTFWSWVKFANH